MIDFDDGRVGDRTPALVALTRRGVSLGRRIQQDLADATLFAPAGLEADQSFDQLADCLAPLFRDRRPILGICAAGILIRILAPLLRDKQSEPAVLALAEDGSAVVPLLGGHHGANHLARRVAGFLGVAPAITTAGDLVLGVSLDEPPTGWRIADPAAIKHVAASLLDGQPVNLEIEAGAADWLATLPRGGLNGPSIRITDRLAHADALTYHPPVLAVGVGCARGSSASAMIAAAEQTLQSAGLAPEAVGVVVSHEIKADEPAVHALAAHFGVPARFFDAAVLLRQTERLSTRSEAVFDATGCWGVAEGSALAAVGDGPLIVPKQIHGAVTVAVARAVRDLAPPSIGRAQGRLFIVGIGPGSAEWRTPQATRAIQSSHHLVGYGLYLDLVGALARGKQRHDTGLGYEEARARRALDLAAEGNVVSLICSGDAGIYALATLVFELLDHADNPAWKRVSIEVVPGISAIQAAAARAGAPIGHDFCTISLSDLLTPWSVIDARLRAAAIGDFVTALYNPRSERRTHQLEQAIDIFRQHRDATTPVVLARNLGRAGERIDILDLGTVKAEMVDMLTLVLIGNRQTRVVEAAGRRVYTPRGYADKREQTLATVLKTVP